MFLNHWKWLINTWTRINCECGTLSHGKSFHLALWDSGTMMLLSITWRKAFLKRETGRRAKGGSEGRREE